MPDEYIWFGLTEKIWILSVRYKIFTASKVSTERKKGKRKFVSEMGQVAYSSLHSYACVVWALGNAFIFCIEHKQRGLWFLGTPA